MPSSPYRHEGQSREIFLARRRSCRMALLVCLFSMAISHSPFFLLPGRSLGFARDDTVGRALSIIRGSQPPALRASPFQRKGGRLSPSFLWKEVPRKGGGWPPACLTILIPVSSFRAKPRNLSCTPIFLPDNSTGLHLFHAISHSPFSLLP